MPLHIETRFDTLHLHQIQPTALMDGMFANEPVAVTYYSDTEGWIPCVKPEGFTRKIVLDRERGRYCIVYPQSKIVMHDARTHEVLFTIESWHMEDKTDYSFNKSLTPTTYRAIDLQTPAFDAYGRLFVFERFWKLLYAYSCYGKRLAVLTVDKEFDFLQFDKNRGDLLMISKIGNIYRIPGNTWVPHTFVWSDSNDKHVPAEIRAGVAKVLGCYALATESMISLMPNELLSAVFKTL